MNRNSSKIAADETMADNRNDFEVIWSHVNYSVRNSWSQKLLKRVQGFKNIPTTKTILTNVNGCIKSGELVAVMGPSGSGKSTLLECIVGKRNVGRTGDILICGENVQSVEVAFVAQKNDFSSQLTVRESILFAAKLLLATKLHNHRMEKTSSLANICVTRTASLILNLGLDECQNNRVNNISGGQMKRLAIAQQLVSNPRILVLDEPTSGLDSLSCLQVVELLRKLAKQDPKMAIMLTIHQPSFGVLSLFDKVYVISQSGECMYENRPISIHNTITKHGLFRPSNCNPADFIIEIAYGEHGLDVVNSLVNEHHGYYKTQFVIPKNNQPLSLSQSNQSFPTLSHTITLFHRSLITTFRNPVLFGIRLITSIVVPFFLVTIFGTKVGLRGGCPPKFGSDFEPSQLDYIGNEIETELKVIYNNIGNLFFLSLYLVFNAMMPTLLAYPAEMIVFKSEKSNNWYGLNAFYFGQLLAEIPLQLSFTTIFWLIVQLLQHQCVEWWRFRTSLATQLLNSFITQTVGYIFGALFMYNVPASVFLGPTACITPTVLLSGIFVKTKSLTPVFEQISKLSYLRFTVEALLVSIYGFKRCGESSSSLAEGREAFVVWMSAMLGIYGESTETVAVETIANATAVNDLGAPSERFVEELIDTISGKFVSDANEVRSAVMNEFKFEDWYLQQDLVILTVYLILIRLIAYIVIAIKVRNNN